MYEGPFEVYEEYGCPGCSDSRNSPGTHRAGAASQGAGTAPLGLPSRSRRQQHKPVSWLLLRPRQPLEGVSRLRLGFDFGLR